MLFLTVTVLTWSASSAFPGYYHGRHKLHTVPEEGSYGKIKYPHFDIIELGDYHKNGLPPKLIHINKKVVIKEPKPYPVKIPHPVPYPVIQKVPYPVVNKEIVKVPEPVPYPVLKTVQIPVEVPKPYPVFSQEYEGSSSAAGQTGYDSDTTDSNQVDFNQNYANLLPHGSQYESNSWQPSGLDEYQKLNEYIHQGEDSLGAKPVYENHQESYTN